MLLLHFCPRFLRSRPAQFKHLLFLFVATSVLSVPKTVAGSSTAMQAVTAVRCVADSGADAGRAMASSCRAGNGQNSRNAS